MKYIICASFLIAFSALSGAEEKSEIPIEGSVYILGKETYKLFIDDHDLVMVEFYSPQCGHCKRLEPEYSKAAKKLKELGVFLAKVDASVEPELAKEYRVEGFPTIFIYKNGEMVENYDGDRTYQAIINHLMAIKDPSWVPPPSDVIVLTEKNFTKFLSGQRLSLGLFYASYCGHCKKIMPEYESAASELKEWGIPLIKVDGIQESDIAAQFDVNGWPTLKVFRRGRAYEYRGGREKEAIVSYMREQAKPPSEEKTSKMSISNNIDRHEATVVGFFSDKSSGLYNEYLTAANEMRGTLRFLHTFVQGAAMDFQVPNDSVVVFMPELFSSPYEEKIFILSDPSVNFKDIIDFIKEKSIPLVGERTTRNAFKYNDRPLIVVYFDVNYDFNFIPDTQFIRSKVIEVAKDYAKTNLHFAISNDQEFAEELKSLGLDGSDAEVNVVCFTDKQKFRMQSVEDFSSEVLAQFIEDLKANKASAYMKSQAIPKEQTHPVKMIVANNYDTEIHKIKKDAVLFIHAPWCGHCKEFDPVYKKLAKKILKSNDNIIFGKIDGTANEIPFIFKDVRGYPSIYFISAYDKFAPILYEGDRSPKHFKDWIKRHANVFPGAEEVEDPYLDEIESFTAETFEVKQVRTKDEL